MPLYPFFMEGFPYKNRQNRKKLVPTTSNLSNLEDLAHVGSHFRWPQQGLTRSFWVFFGATDLGFEISDPGLPQAGEPFGHSRAMKEALLTCDRCDRYEGINPEIGPLKGNHQLDGL